MDAWDPVSVTAIMKPWNQLYDHIHRTFVRTDFLLGSRLWNFAAARIQSLATPRWPSTQQPTSNRRDLPPLSCIARGACAITGQNRASAERGECERRKQCTCFHSACRSRPTNLPFLLPRTQSDLWCVGGTIHWFADDHGPKSSRV